MSPTDTDKRLAEIAAYNKAVPEIIAMMTPAPMAVCERQRVHVSFLLSLVERLSRELLEARSVGAPLGAAPISAEGSIPSPPCPSPPSSPVLTERDTASSLLKRVQTFNDPVVSEMFDALDHLASPPSSPTPPAPEAAPASDLSSGATGSEGGHGPGNVSTSPESPGEPAPHRAPAYGASGGVTQAPSRGERVRPCPDCNDGRSVAGRAERHGCNTCGGARFVGVP